MPVLELLWRDERKRTSYKKNSYPLYLLVLMPIILHVDGLSVRMADTRYAGRVTPAPGPALPPLLHRVFLEPIVELGDFFGLRRNNLFCNLDHFCIFAGIDLHLRHFNGSLVM